jgi:hypothetical protein
MKWKMSQAYSDEEQEVIVTLERIGCGRLAPQQLHHCLQQASAIGELGPEDPEKITLRIGKK